ncbi:MAG: YcjF family protein [Sandaracinaceae bacterium]
MVDRTHGSPNRRGGTERREANERRDSSELDDWMKVLNRLPFVGQVTRDLGALRKLIYDRRAPRIAVIGARAEDRMALANRLLTALAFGPEGAAPPAREGQWVRIDADGRRLDWLELAVGPEIVERSREGLDATLPDVVIALVSANASADDVRSACANAGALAKYIRNERSHDVAVLVVMDGVETLPPHPSDPAEKADAIRVALADVREAAYELQLDEADFVAVASGPVRFGYGDLAERLLARLPPPAQLEAIRAFEVTPDARREIARQIVNSCTALALTVGITPIPFADVFVLLPLQVAMVTAIAYTSGRPWDRRAAAEWVASIGGAAGAGLGLRWSAQQLAKLVPGAGTLVSASVAGAGTLAIGRSAIAYFVDGPGRLSERKELRAENP